MRIDNIMRFIGLLLAIFLILIIYENYTPHKRYDTKYLIDTLYKDTLKIDTCLNKIPPHKRDK